MERKRARLAPVARGTLIVLLLCTAHAACAQQPRATSAEVTADTPPADDPTIAAGWAYGPSMPQGVFSAALSRVEDHVVITGGVNQVGLAENAVQVFDLRQQQWRPITRMTHPRCQHVQVALRDGRVLVAGGRAGHVLGTMHAVMACELIDPATGESHPAPDLPAATGPARSATAHLLSDGRAVLVGGAAAAVFDPVSDQWTQVIPFRQRRREHASVLLPGDIIVVIGGDDRDTIEWLDIPAGTSLLLDVKLPDPLDDLRAALLPDGRIWIIGGQHTRTGLTTDRTWLLTPPTPPKPRHSDAPDQTTKRPPHAPNFTLTPGPRLHIEHGIADALILTHHDSILVVGGESDLGDRDIELRAARRLDTRTMTLYRLPDTIVPHDDAVGLVVGDDVLIFGGLRTQFDLPVAGMEVERLQLLQLR